MQGDNSQPLYFKKKKKGKIGNHHYGVLYKYESSWKFTAILKVHSGLGGIREKSIVVSCNSANDKSI